MNTDRIFTNEDAGNFVRNIECIVCGTYITQLVPKDYYTDQWHNFFECCNRNCLENYFDYDEFKKEFKNNKEVDSDSESEWKQWCRLKIIKEGWQVNSPEELFDFHDDIAKCLCKERELLERGFPVEQAEDLAWSVNPPLNICKI